MINRDKNSTDFTSRSEGGSVILLNELTDLLNTMTETLSQFGQIYNRSKESVTFTNR